LHQVADGAAENWPCAGPNHACDGVFTSLAFPGAARATTGGPMISEFETELTSGVGLWGITAGRDGNL
jgi:hypothetical protein